MVEKFLDGAYTLEEPQQTKDLYRRWASTYDAEINDNGYESPQRTAHALKTCYSSRSTSIEINIETLVLDIGCGTGVSGYFLQQQGFTQLIGSDFSPEMLAIAESKNIYKDLFLADLKDPFKFLSAPPAIVTAVGVMAPGHAKASLINGVIEITPQAGLFGFSLNDHTMSDPEYLEVINNLVQQRVVRIRWQEYGDHLPKIELNSLIVVLEKL